MTETTVKQPKSHKVRNIIITVIVLLVISGVIRAFMISDHNQKELRERGIVPVPSSIIKTLP